MKLTIERIALLVLGIVLIIFVMRDCSRPGEEREAEREKLFKTNIAILEADKKEIQAAQDSIGKVLIQRTRKDSLAIKRQESVIQALERKAARQRVVVDTLILNNPDLLAFVTTQTEVIQELKVEIDTLKAQKEFHRMVNQDLIAQEFIEDKIEHQIAIEQTQRIEELGKQSRRKERKSRLAKVLIPIALVGGFLFGSSL